MAKLVSAGKHLALMVLLVSGLFALPAAAQQGFQLPDDIAELSAEIFSEGTRPAFLSGHRFTYVISKENFT